VGARGEPDGLIGYLAGVAGLMAHGEVWLAADFAMLDPISPTTVAIAGSAAELFAPSSSFDGMVQYAVIRTLADHASAFQRLAKTVVILGPMNMAPA
jgi:hypothetical protein